MSVDAEVLGEFLAECVESLEKLDDALLSLEADLTPDQVAAAFRSMHSIKGAAGFMEADELERVAHHAENLLGAVRDGTVTPGPSDFSLLFSATALIASQLEALDGGTECPVADPDLLKRLDAARAGGEAPVKRGVTMLNPVQPSPNQDAPVASAVRPPKAEPPAASPPAASPPAASPPKGTASASASSSETVRVDVGLLDNLMNLVGELVVCRNQINRVSHDELSNDMQTSIRQLDHLTSTLQDRVMKTRMRPVGAAWGRLPRMVRDLATSCDKSCTLTMEGEDVELDRSMLDRIKDPLAHMIRNAVDHGLEDRATRLAAGKPESGRIHLRAMHVGGQVHIELSDDGCGLDTEAIRAKAVERGVVVPERAASLSDEEVHQLIFEPGFSTASKVTRLSGRGVGMDVVRSTLTSVGGSVEVSSRFGEGSKICLKIPLTLAILPALIVRCNGRSFAIPQAHLIELVDLVCGKNHTVEDLAGAAVLRRRGELLPLVHVGECLGFPRSEARDEYVVVVQADDLVCGLVVDDVAETEEIVVKPLGDELSQIDAFSGATVRGDGSIALILDVVRLCRSAHASNALPPPSKREEATPSVPLLRFDVHGVGLGAVPVADVVRIDDVVATDLQRHGAHWFRDHRGRVVPVADLVGLDVDNPHPVSLVVCRAEEALVAVAVSEVLEVVEVPLEVTPGVGEPWARGMAMVCGVSTGLLDVQRLVRS